MAGSARWQWLLALACQPLGADAVIGSIASLANSGVTTGLAVFVVLLLVVFLVKYRDRVLMALTGDDRIHGDSLDCMWWAFCRCFGTCHGDWTRHCTRCCSCLDSCGLTWLRGANLVRVFGQAIGLVPLPVEIKSLVAGDLPFDSRGDFYLSVECSTNPPMVTSLIEESRPKVVHFPEVLTLKLRRSPMEPRVRFVVKELNVFGSNELCELYLSAMQILDWMDDDANERMKRFQMTVLDNSLERVTPPWICMEFSRPTEVRDLMHLTNFSTVRTMDIKNETDTLFVDKSVKLFKDDYTLLDGTGNPVDEPDEDDLAVIEHLRRALKYCLRCINMLIFWAILAYCSVRFYIWSCYRQFTWITQVYENVNAVNRSLFQDRFPLISQVPFPVSQNHLQDVVTWCSHQVEGTGIASGIPCRPNFNQTLYICDACCDNATGANCTGDSILQPRPKAFGALIHQFVGVEGLGLKCAYGICRLRNRVVQYDSIALVAILGAVALTFVLQCMGNECIRRKKRSQQAAKTQRKKDFETARRTGTIK